LTAPTPPKGNGELRYRRILLKLSGEALQGSSAFGIDPSTLDTIARQVAAVIARASPPLSPTPIIAVAFLYVVAHNLLHQIDISFDSSG